MASAEIHALALGADHITYARFSKNSVGVCVLLNTAREGLGFTPENSERWLSLLDEGLKKLSGRGSLKKVTSVILPAWCVLSKSMKFTHVQGEGQDEVIRYEAGKSLPHGLDEYEWTYDVVSDDGVDCEAVFHAIQTDFLEDIKAIIKMYGIKPIHMDAEVSALVNVYGLDYSTLGDASLILDIGARSSSLLIASKEGAPFLRNLSFGGLQHTQLIAKKTGETFEDAEVKKLKWILQGDTNSDSHEVTSGFVQRIANEVNRSLALYRRQTGNDNPGRILLLGGVSGLLGLDEFLKKMTGIEVEAFNARCDENGVSGIPREDVAILVGAVTASNPGSVLKTNFLGDNGLVGGVSNTQRRWFLVAIILFLCAGLMFSLKPHFEAFHLQDKSFAMERELFSYESLAGDVQTEFDNYNALLAEEHELKSIDLGRQYWVSFLADLQNRMSEVEDVWLESISSEKTDTSWRLRLGGSLLDRENPLSQVSLASRSRVEALLNSFSESPFISAVEDKRFDTSQPGILRFDFSIILTLEESL